MASPHESTCERLQDPDPIVVDLLVNLGATAIAGVLVKLGRGVYQRWRQRPAPGINQNLLGVLEGSLESFEGLLHRAFQLFHPGTRRELGGVLLLNSNQIHQYHEIRESLFDQLRKLDDLSQELSSEFERPDDSQERDDAGLPREFRAQVSFIANRLHDARVATLAEEAFLEIKAALVAIRRMLEQLKQKGRKR